MFFARLLRSFLVAYTVSPRLGFTSFFFGGFSLYPFTKINEIRDYDYMLHPQ